MHSTSAWYSDYTQEMARAQAARLAGNEGMARVCARRAAGIVIKEYLSRSGYDLAPASAHKRLKLLETLPDIDPQTKLTASHFLLPVDKDHRLPPHIDLLSEAHKLAQTLLGEQ
jgi:hypothetical protein